MFETFTGISSVLALGTLLSLATEGGVTFIKVNKKAQTSKETLFQGYSHMILRAFKI